MWSGTAMQWYAVLCHSGVQSCSLFNEVPDSFHLVMLHEVLRLGCLYLCSIATVILVWIEHGSEFGLKIRKIFIIARQAIISLSCIELNFVKGSNTVISMLKHWKLPSMFSNIMQRCKIKNTVHGNLPTKAKLSRMMGAVLWRLWMLPDACDSSLPHTLQHSLWHHQIDLHAGPWHLSASSDTHPRMLLQWLPSAPEISSAKDYEKAFVLLINCMSEHCKNISQWLILKENYFNSLAMESSFLH